MRARLLFFIFIIVNKIEKIYNETIIDCDDFKLTNNNITYLRQLFIFFIDRIKSNVIPLHTNFNSISCRPPLSLPLTVKQSCKIKGRRTRLSKDDPFQFHVESHPIEVESKQLMKIYINAHLVVIPTHILFRYIELNIDWENSLGIAWLL